MKTVVSMLENGLSYEEGKKSGLFSGLKTRKILELNYWRKYFYLFVPALVKN